MTESVVNELLLKKERENVARIASQILDLELKDGQIKHY